MVGNYNWKDNYIKVVCVDFDGVLHDYTKNEWRGHDKVTGPAIAGAIDWLKDLIANKNFVVKIYSYRSKYQDGHIAMRDWLLANGMTEKELEQIEFPFTKPVAFVSIDDRCICYDGKKHPTVEEINNFESWLE